MSFRAVRGIFPRQPVSPPSKILLTSSPKSAKVRNQKEVFLMKQMSNRAYGYCYRYYFYSNGTFVRP